MKNNTINATQDVAAGESPAMFSNPEFGSVRIIVKENSEPLFCGKDVATCLGYSDPSKAVSVKVDDEDKGIAILATPGGEQEAAFINESGLYSLILGSKLDSAKKFKRWVTSEVLPSIRKTGSYSVPQKKVPQTYIEALEETLRLAKENEKLALENKKQAKEVTKLSHKIEEDAPKVECWDKFVGESNELISITDFAKVLHNKWPDITPHRLFAILREAKILQDGYFNKNIPYQHYIKEGYFKVKEKPSVNKVGLNFISRQTLVTPKGQKYLIGKFLTARASDEENDIDMFE